MCDKTVLSGGGFHIFDNVEADLEQKFGNWEVKDDGSIIYHGNSINSLSEIEASQLPSIDVVHTMRKEWKDYKDACNFFFAYLEALRNADYNRLFINLKNHYSSKVE